jgi:hypothetical protein
MGLQDLCFVGRGDYSVFIIHLHGQDVEMPLLNCCVVLYRTSLHSGRPVTASAADALVYGHNALMAEPLLKKQSGPVSKSYLQLRTSKKSELTRENSMPCGSPEIKTRIHEFNIMTIL